MIITWSNIGYQRTQHIERCFGTLFHLLFNIKLNLIHRYMARPFHHHLYIMFPSATSQLT
ncbi:hypothetical protein CY0110_19647 [Crocosphaera chwakensis CCY0110]|uniref:Uncharacterized protein n=1 Tax=Crocosphaera chwakensis CCY0110 TaxID=391612 RepID=A3IJR1_9CHRO|nr:hypothetical protein CY0110_19647 [Crocosphaera chwakensis CCY0110]